MRIKLKYPQITIAKKEIEVTDDEWEVIDNMPDSEKAKFIYKNLNEDEQDWSGGLKNIEGALDVDYARITKMQDSL